MTLFSGSRRTTLVTHLEDKHCRTLGFIRGKGWMRIGVVRGTLRMASKVLFQVKKEMNDWNLG
jgi:hypothetical protein